MCACVCVCVCVCVCARASGCVRTRASRRPRPGRHGTPPGPAEVPAAGARHEPATPRGSPRSPATPRARSASQPPLAARTASRWRRPRRGHRSRARSWPSHGGSARRRRRRGGRESRCIHRSGYNHIIRQICSSSWRTCLIIRASWQHPAVRCSTPEVPCLVQSLRTSAVVCVHGCTISSAQDGACLRTTLGAQLYAKRMP